MDNIAFVCTRGGCGAMDAAIILFAVIAFLVVVGVISAVVLLIFLGVLALQKKPIYSKNVLNYFWKITLITLMLIAVVCAIIYVKYKHEDTIKRKKQTDCFMENGGTNGINNWYDQTVYESCATK